MAPARVIICHVDGSGAVRELSVNQRALPAHLRHGDTLPLTFYQDTDGDGFGSGGDVAACVQPPGFVPNDLDCDDGDAAINPDATEACDGVDNNCDGTTDEGFDQDADGFTTCNGDCNDGDAAINPDAVEVCDAVDNNCDAAIDEGFDQDGDGVTTCAGDCDDGEATVYPGAPEICFDGLDSDCDGVENEGCTGTIAGTIGAVHIDTGTPPVPPITSGLNVEVSAKQGGVTISSQVATFDANGQAAYAIGSLVPGTYQITAVPVPPIPILCVRYYRTIPAFLTVLLDSAVVGGQDLDVEVAIGFDPAPGTCWTVP